jgi:hypothetical protein
MIKKVVIFIGLFFLFLNFSLSQNLLKRNYSLDTIIVSAPPFVVEDNYIQFKLKGVNNKNPEDKFYFQVKLWPLETKWRNVYKQDVYYTLPKKQQFYTFYARAVNYKNEYDPIPAKYFFMTNISQYYKDIKISISPDGTKIYLINNSKQDINVTNWKIQTSNIAILIPQAIKDFHPDPQQRKLEDIVLRPNDKLIVFSVYFSTTSAPISLRPEKIPLAPFGFGNNFLGNQCFGYLLKDYPSNYCDIFNFSKDELLQMVLEGKISSQCADILKKTDCLGSRALSKSKEINDSKCRAIIENWFNYNSCYSRNKNKENFYGKEWRVYIDPRTDQDKFNRKPLPRLFKERYEQIKLYDSKGLLVNKYNIY